MNTDINLENSGLKRPLATSSDSVDPNLADTVDKILKLDEVRTHHDQTNPVSRILDRRKSSTDRPLTDCEIVDLLKKMKRYHRSGGDLNAMVADIQSVGLNGEDWRENPVVLQEIFDRLPAKDIKSVRFVCKLWSIVAAVPLSYKTRATSKKTQQEESEGRRNNSRGLTCKGITSYLNYMETKSLSTGIRLRHVELQHKYDQYWTRSIEDTWVDFFSSEHFDTVVSLRIYGCPANVVNNLLLPCYLPRYWSQLKSLKICGNLRGQEVEKRGQDADWAPGYSTDLEALHLDLAITNEYDWTFLKYCPKLKNFSLTISETAEDDREGTIATSDKFEAMLRSIAWGLKPIRLEKLKLTLDVTPTVALEVAPAHNILPAFLSYWKPFFYNLVSVNMQTLRRISLKTSMDPLHVDRFTTGLVLPIHLKYAKFIFLGDLNPWMQQLPYYEIFKNLQYKGFLNLPRLEVLVAEKTRFQKLRVIVHDKQKLLVQVGAHTYAPRNFDLSAQFQNLLSQEFPNINYICWPKQRLFKEEQILDTSLHERLGKDQIFDLPVLHQEWSSLDGNDIDEEDISTDPDKSDIIDPELVTTKSLSVSPEWTREDLTEPNATVYVFDHIPNLAEAWKFVQDKNMECTSSTVPEDFIPSVVLNDQETYAFRRDFCTRLSSENWRC